MARKKRDFDYMELYNPDYRAMKANIFSGEEGSSTLDLMGNNGINTDWTFGQQQNNITAPNTMYSNITTVNDGTPAGNYVDPLQTEYHRVNPIKYLTMSEAERMRQNQLRQEARQERREARQEAKQAAQTDTQNDGGTPWGNIIGTAATGIINGIKNNDWSTKEGRTRGIFQSLGVADAANNWLADTRKGDANITEMTNRINNATNKLIQDSNDTQGAFSAIKNNNTLNLIDTGIKPLGKNDFLQSWGSAWKNTATGTLQGAAAGSVGGPWGALGGATIGTLSGLFGMFGRKNRARKAYEEYKNKMDYLQRFAGNFNSLQRLNQQQSNENLLSNGLKQQRIQDLANIRAFGGNLFDDGGDLGDDYIYEGRMLPEAVVESESMPWYEKGWRKFDRNVLKYPKYAFNYFFPDKNKFIVLDDNTEVNRITDENSASGNDYILSNEFVERKNPNTIRTAKDFQSPNQDTLLGDKKIPLSNISTYYGIENGKFKAGKVSDFDDDTFIVPNRTKNIGKIKNIQLPEEGEYDWGMPWSDKRAKSKELQQEYDELYEKFVTQKKYEKELRREFDKLYGQNNSTKQVAGKRARRNLVQNHQEEFNEYMADWNKRHKELMESVVIREPHQGYAINENNDTIPLPSLYNTFNATPKMYFADENGNAAFVSGLKPNIEKVNNFLFEHPSYPIMIDNGRFEHIIEGDDINAYTGGFVNPEDNYIIGVRQRALGGNIFDNSKQYDNVAAMGGQFDTFNLSPNMIDMQNQSLYNQKYKYINQLQPTGFIDGGKTPTNGGYPRFALGGCLNKFDFGGSMNGMDIPTGIQVYENGGTHEENPNGGIQVGVDQQGIPNFTEEGEVRYGNYVFSDRIKVDLNILSDFNLAPATKHQNKRANKGKLSYADMAKKMIKKAGDLNDPITKDTLNENMKRASQAQDFQKAQMNSDNQLADYKNALKNQTQGNPMYGSMKYNGMGNVNQGLNEGSSAMEGVDNSSLSNVNRSGNAMMAAYGGNLYPDGGNIIISNQGVEFRKQPDGTWMSANGYTLSDEEMQQFVDNGEATMRPISTNPAIAVDNDITKMYNPELSPRESYAQQFNSPTWTSTNGVTPMNPLYNIDVNLGFGQTQKGALGNGNIYNQQFGLGIRPDYVASKNPNKTVEAVSTYGKNVNGQIQYDPNGKPVMLYPNTFKGMNGKEQTMNSTFGSPINTTFSLDPVNVDTKGFYKFGNTQNTGTSSPTNGSSYSSTSSYSKTVSRNQGANENMPEIPPAESTQEGLPSSKDQAGIVDNRNLDEKHAQFATATTPVIPTLNTKGLYAQLGKGLTKNIYNWAGLANTEFKPNYKPEQDLRALGRTGYVPRTADHSGMYRAADLYDINLANNAAQAQAAATARAMSNVNDRNQRAANQLAADYNAMLGVGNNYQTMFDANMKSRLATDEYNKQTEQTNVAANNDMYRDNQQAGIQAKNFELSANTAANQMQWAKDQYADTQNRISALNKQSDAARMADNQINFLVDKAKENAYYNLKNKDPRQMYWNDPSTGEWQFKGDNGYYNNLRRAMNGKINSLDTTSNEELAAIADQKGWNNITEEDMRDIIDRQAEREKKISDDKKAKDAQDLRNAQIQYKQMLANIRAVNPDYNPGFKDSDFTTADDWLTGYNGLNTYWLSAINPYLANRKVDNENAYGGKIKTNKRNKNHSYDYMAI